MIYLTLKSKLIAAGTCFVLAGCGGPPDEVLKLADKTAANVGTISAHLRQLSKNGQAMGELRASRIAALHQSNTKLRADYEYDVELVKKSGDGKNLALIADIENWTKKVDAIFKKAEGAAEARKKLVLETQTKIDTKSKALSEIAQSLAALAKKDKRKDRIRFLKGYAKDLKKELDKALDADNESAKAAKKLIDTAKTQLSDGLSSAKSRLNANN